MSLTCLIIDDEPSAQTVLKKYIQNVDFLELAGVCNNAIEGLQKLKENPCTDLIFLDINMPKISGLTFYKSLLDPPEVVFTTAYPQYAIDGFEVNAIDYLLKPFSFDRFFTAINKFLDKKSNSQHKSDSQFLLIKSNKTLHKIPVKDINFIEAFGDYVKIHTANKTILTNNTFTFILGQLPNKVFIRCHKSFAINSEKMNHIRGNQISIQNLYIPIGQKYKAEFLKFINSSN